MGNCPSLQHISFSDSGETVKLSYTFRLNKTFSFIWDHRWGTLDEYCYADPDTENRGHVLVCEGRAKRKGWDLVSREDAAVQCSCGMFHCLKYRVTQ